MIRRPRFYVRRVPLGLDTESKDARGYLLIVFDEDLRDSMLYTPDGKLVTIPLKGKRTKEEELRKLLRGALGATLVGEHAVGIAIQEGLVHPKAITYLRDESGREVPYAMYIVLRMSSGMRWRYRYFLIKASRALLYTLSSSEATKAKARGAKRS